MSWSEARLADCVLEMRSGASIKSDDFTDVGFPVLHKGSIKEGGKVVVDRDGKSHVATQYADQKPRAIVDSRYVVATLRNLVRTGETLGYMAPVPSGSEYILAQGAYGLLLDESKLDKRYLSYLSNATVFHKEVLRRMVGSTQVHIRNSQFLDIPIPLPPLEEQKRIAKILDAADALRAKRRESLAQLDALLQSTFLDLFGDPVTNPKGWQARPLGEMMRIRRGGSPRPIDSYLGGTINWIKIGDATRSDDDIYISSCAEKITEEGLSKTTFLDEGSFVFANSGVSLGFARILKVKGAIHDGWLAFDEFSEGLLNKLFFLKALNQITLHFRKTAPSGTQPNLNTGIMKSFMMIVPPVELQNQFARFVEGVERQKAMLRSHMDELDTLMESLQSNAFSGEL